MRKPHMSQGKPRSLPDGFLHLNNFSHVASSGLAGVLYERVFTERQQEIVGCALLEIANGNPEFVHFKHNVWRFQKEFLKTHFQPAVYAACRLIRKRPAEMMSVAITHEELNVQRTVVAWPSFDNDI